MRAKEPTASMKDSSLHELFLDELKDIYWAEQQLVKNLPKVAKAATSPELKEAIESHLQETENHVTRLEQIFENLGKKATTTRCEAIAGLIEETQRMIKNTEDGTLVRDVAIISCAQKVEHYEIATYGTLRALADTMGHSEEGELLSATLEEEKAANSKLTEIAESSVNEKAEEEKK